MQDKSNNVIPIEDIEETFNMLRKNEPNLKETKNKESKEKKEENSNNHEKQK